MDIAHPIRSVVPSLDGIVLEVLAGTTRPLSRRQIARIAGTGSESGIRLALLRLAEQGVVLADDRGNAVYYTGNRRHLAWPAIELLAGLRSRLRERVAAEIAALPIRPLHASLFGSAARGDGDTSSDVDILLVRPGDADGETWDAQVEHLRAGVEAWTGNRCQVFETTRERLAEHAAARDPLLEAWLTEGVLLAGGPLRELVEAIVVRGAARRVRARAGAQRSAIEPTPGRVSGTPNPSWSSPTWSSSSRANRRSR